MWKNIMWWELRRVFFNTIMLISGLLFLFIVQRIKPVFSHFYFRFYFDLILAYGIFVNIAYTAVYIYVLRLIKKINASVENKIEIRDFTFRIVLLVGFIANLCAGIFELMYRLYYTK